jgi:hypothetical protein
MSSNITIRCTSCQGSECRRSRWLSHDEKHHHPAGSHPYRCLACKHRFVAVAGTRSFRGVAAAAAAVLVAAIVAGVAALGLKGGAEGAAAEAAAADDKGPFNARILEQALGGDPAAQLKVAKGLLVEASFNPESTTQAIEWLRAAIAKGSTGAMVELGKLYRNGIGVLQDYDEAGRWIETAANRGDPEGTLELGRLYREGVVFKRDPVLAYVWFNRAAAVLNMSAVWERDEIGRQLDPAQLKEAQDKSAAPLLADAEGEQAGDSLQP